MKNESAELRSGSMRWEQVSKNHLQRDVAEQFSCDADEGRYTIRRRKRDQNWEAQFINRNVSLRLTHIETRAMAEAWCSDVSGGRNG